MTYQTIYDYLQRPSQNVYCNQWRPGLDSNMKVEDDNDDKIYTISELISLLWVNYRYYLDNDIDYSLYNDRTCISISLFFSYLYVSWLLNSMLNFELCMMWYHLNNIIFCGNIHFASIYENVKEYFLSLELLKRDK